MGYRSTKTAVRKLITLAQGQAGYFTAKQAAEIGYNYPHLDYHVRAGNFERVGHGVYRIPEIPLDEHDDLVRLAFWSRDRDDQSRAVASHQTALAVHGLSDLLPSKVHLTVPLSFRKKAPKGAILHRGELAGSDTVERGGFQVTSPLKTLLDVAADDRVGDEHVRKAIAEALERGLVRKASLVAAAKKPTAPARLSRMLASLA